MKKIAISIAILFSGIMFGGCVSKPFQPPTKTYQDWIDGRHSELEIKKALLECGYPSPFADYPPYGVDVSFTKDTYIKNYKCMLKAGFVNNLNHSFNACYDSVGLPCVKNSKCKSTPMACELPWDQIPDRSIKKRLESDYCKHKLYKTYPVCQP